MSPWMVMEVFWVVCEYYADCCVEVFCEEWIVSWFSVDVDDGVYWVGFSLVAVDLEDGCRCLGDVDVV